MIYSAYNLTIQSDISLPLPPCVSGNNPDMCVTLGHVQEPENLSRTYDGVWYSHENEQIYLMWGKIGIFSVKEGRQIIVEISEDKRPPLALITTPLVGTVMALALYQKGLAVLHGSSVSIDGKAVIFVGEKREGKSTIAAYFSNRGHEIISDDVCALDLKSEIPGIFPSFPAIKLWPDAMEQLNYKPENHPKVHPEFEKRHISLKEGFAVSSVEVGSIIVLKTGPGPFVERLSGHSPIPELLPHLIINRFSERQPASTQKNIFRQMDSLLNKIPIYKLTRPRDISLLPTLPELISNAFYNGEKS